MLHPLRLSMAMAATAALACAETPAPAVVTTPAPPAVAPAPALPKLPWHLVNLWWVGPEIKDFREFSIDVDISCDIPSDKYNLYISTVYGDVNGFPVYGGIQSNCNGWDALAPESKKRLHGGPGFIFSRWSKKPDLSLADVRATPGGFVECAGYEGDFVSGRRPYGWKAGKYTYSLRRLDTQKDKSGAHTWLGCFVKEHATGHEIFVSALRFEGESLRHSGVNGTFIEFYATEKIPTPPVIAELPPLVVKYSNLRFNGAPAPTSAVKVRYVRTANKRPDGLPEPVSPNLLRVSASEDGSEITCALQNKPLADTEEPSRDLWKKPVAKPAAK